MGAQYCERTVTGTLKCLILCYVKFTSILKNENKNSATRGFQFEGTMCRAWRPDRARGVGSCRLQPQVMWLVLLEGGGSETGTCGHREECVFSPKLRPM